MANKIRIKRGLRVYLPSADLSRGQPHFTTDRGNLYIATDDTTLLPVTPPIDELVNLTTFDNANDYLLGYDASASGQKEKKISLANLKTQIVVPSGSTTQIQFNNAGVFTGDSSLIWDTTNKRLGVGVTPTHTFNAQFDSNGYTPVAIFKNINATGSAIITLDKGSDASNIRAVGTIHSQNGTTKWFTGVPARGGSSQSGLYAISSFLNLSDGGGEVLISATGNMNVGGAFASLNLARLAAVGSSAAAIVSLIQGATSQSGNLLRIQDSAATVLLRVTAAGLFGIGVDPVYTLDLAVNNSGATTGTVRFSNTNATGGNAIFIDKGTDASLIGHACIRITSNNVLKWQVGIPYRGGSSNSGIFSISQTADINGTGGEFTLNTNGNCSIGGGWTNNDIAKLSAVGSAAAKIVLLARMHASQSLNPFEVQNSGGTAVNIVNTSGWVGAGKTLANAPFDGQTNLNGDNLVGAFNNIHATGGALLDVNRGADASNVRASCIRLQQGGVDRWVVGTPRRGGSAHTNVFAISSNYDISSGGSEFLLSTLGNIAIGSSYANMDLARLSVVGSNAALQTVIWRMAASQSANAFELQDNTGSIKLAIGANGRDFKWDTTTGTKLGTTTSQKMAFWNATPIIQPTTAVAAATFVANTSGTINDTATFDGYTIGQVVKALRNEGLLA